MNTVPAAPKGICNFLCVYWRRVVVKEVVPTPGNRKKL